MKYLLSAGYNNQVGMLAINPDTYNKYNIRAKLDFQANKWLRVSNNTTYFTSRYDYHGYASVNNDFLQTTVGDFASIPTHNPDGTLVATNRHYNSPVANAIIANPGNKHYNQIQELSTITEATITPFKDLVIKANYNYVFYFNRYVHRITNSHYSQYPGIIETYSTGAHGADHLTEDLDDNYYQQANIYATYTKSFGNHNFKLMGGANWETKYLKTVTVDGYYLLSEELNDLNLVGAEVCHATYPYAKRPQWRHGRETCQHTVAAHDFLRRLSANQEYVKRSPVAHKLYRTRRVVSQRELAVVARMVETTIHATRHVEWDILIAAAVVHTLPVLILQLECLPTQVHLPKPLASTHKAFVRIAFEGDGGALSLVCGVSIATY